jgi:hypothetical protein
MGATVNAYWPGITEEQRESGPGFYNDSKAWGEWMAEREDVPAVSGSLERLGAAALLTYKTDGVEDDEVDWVTPAQLRDAAARLREAVLAGSPESGVILETYTRGRIPAASADFVRDLEDVIAMTRWAEEEGAEVMTLEVNW